MSKKSDKLRSELINKIWGFLESRGITELEAADVDEGNSPIVCYDYSDLEDHFTLDRLVVDKEYGTVTVDGSNTYSNDDWELDELSIECLEGILEWLEDNEDTIDELYEEVDEDDDEDEEELSTEELATINQIEALFGTLSSAAKVSVMVSLYYDMYDGEKDEFLRETENG